MSYKIHIIDDEPIIHDIILRVLKDKDYVLEFSTNIEESLEKHKKQHFDLVLLDLMIPGTSGIQIFKELKRIDSDVKVIIMTAYGTLETAVKAVEMGAIDYLNKPFDNQHLIDTIEKALLSSNKKNIDELKDSFGKADFFHNLVGKSEAIKEVIKKIKKVAKTNSTVLIYGESGTGKELVARAIHMESLRNTFPFVVAYSAPDDLFESNLFGHKKGAFTGAVADKTGLIEVAKGGTLFFDDVATVPLQTQVKLLRVIQEKEYIVVGDTKVRKADVRVIAATNQELSQMVEEGKFREDLYYRLNVIKIEIPPLRERREDIPLLVNFFVKKYGEINSKKIDGVDQTALEYLMNYHWPGNVRELENVVESMVVLSETNILTKDDIPLEKRYTSIPFLYNLLELNGVSLKDKTEQLKEYLLLKALKKANGVQKKAAQLLGMKSTTFNEMLKRLDLKNKKIK